MTTITKTKTQAEKPLGFIDHTTKIGTRFVSSTSDGKDLICTFEGFKGERVVLRYGEKRDQIVCDPQDRKRPITAKDWNEAMAADVVEALPPQEGNGDSKATVAPKESKTLTTPGLAPVAELVAVEVTSITAQAQPRTDFQEAALFELDASIERHGHLQPIVVLERKDDYLLIAGDRRLRVAIGLGQKHIRAMVHRGLNDRQVYEMQLAENFQRRDLTHVETARALGRLRDAGASVAAIAEQVHKSPDYVREHLDLLRLADDVQDLVASGKLPIKQAAMISRIGDHEDQRGVASYVAEDEDGNVAPMESVRVAVYDHLKALGGCGWPMDEPYADRQPCLGCIDNTATELGLFEGISLPGKSKKGNCTNAACFAAKAAAWEKDPEKKRREKERQAKQKAKGADGKTTGGRKMSAKETALERRRKGFPSTAAEQYAVALWKYGQVLHKAIVKFARTTERLPDDALAIAVRLLAAGKNRSLWDCKLVDKFDVLRQQLLAGEKIGIIKSHTSELLREGTSLCQKPDWASWRNKPNNVPLPSIDVKMIECLEALAGRWGVKIKAKPPVLSEFKDKEAEAEAVNKASSKTKAKAKAKIKARKPKARAWSRTDCCAETRR